MITEKHVEYFFNHLSKAGWNIVPGNRDISMLPQEDRFPGITEFLRPLLSAFSLAESPDKKTWLLSQSDFMGGSDTAYKWNEMETQSLKTAAGNQKWTFEIKEFWAHRIPLIFSVNSGYSALGIHWGLENRGRVFISREPEYEEPEELELHIVNVFMNGLPSIL